MTKPTYEELVAEVARLRAKLSFGEDEEFTAYIVKLMPTKEDLANKGYIKNGRITVRPAELWGLLLSPDMAYLAPSTRELAKLGRSLQALGWARSAQRGNLVFTIQVDEYAK
jgi:hypothetical protein